MHTHIHIYIVIYVYISACKPKYTKPTVKLHCWRPNWSSSVLSVYRIDLLASLPLTLFFFFFCEYTYNYEWLFVIIIWFIYLLLLNFFFLKFENISTVLLCYKSRQSKLFYSSFIILITWTRLPCEQLYKPPASAVYIKMAKCGLFQVRKPYSLTYSKYTRMFWQNFYTALLPSTVWKRLSHYLN